MDFRICDHLKEDGSRCNLPALRGPRLLPPTPLNRASLGLNSLWINHLPVSPTGSILCADFRLSPPVFSGLYGQGEGEGYYEPPTRLFPRRNRGLDTAMS